MEASEAARPAAKASVVACVATAASSIQGRERGGREREKRERRGKKERKRGRHEKERTLAAGMECNMEGERALAPSLSKCAVGAEPNLENATSTHLSSFILPHLHLKRRWRHNTIIHLLFLSSDFIQMPFVNLYLGGDGEAAQSSGESGIGSHRLWKQIQPAEPLQQWRNNNTTKYVGREIGGKKARENM